MTRTSLPLLLALALLGGGVAWLVRALLDGATGPLVPLTTGVLPVLIAGVLLVLGRRVRRLVRGEDAKITPIGAARVAIAAQAASRVGAAMGGLYAAVALQHWLAPPSPLATEQTWAGAGAAAGFLALVVVALVVEEWCAVDPPDDEDDAERAGSTGPVGVA